MNIRRDQKRFLVTGGNSGIGAAIAAAMVAAGGEVLLAGRNAETLDATAARLGERAVAVRADVARLADIDTLAAAVAARPGGFDGIVLAAGIAKPSGFAETTPELFDEHFAINVRGAFFTVQRMAPHLADGGSITWITSALQSTSAAGMSAYGASGVRARRLRDRRVVRRRRRLRPALIQNGAGRDWRRAPRFVVMPGMQPKTLSMHDGGAMPALGLGTWKSAAGEVGAAVRAALEAGYRHIDCAAIYGNEAEVGAALAGAFRDGVVARDDLWITSKLWNDRHAPEDVAPALRETLAALGLERLDLYLMHWPVALVKGVPIPESAADMIGLDALPVERTWEAMEATVDAGLTRYIGVSNFSEKKLSHLHASARIPPAVDQVEMHPYLRQQDLVDFCRANGIVVTAYSPLGSPDRPAMMVRDDEPRLLEDDTVRSIAARLDASPAQVLIAWALARDTAVIPKSVHPARIQQNLEAASLELSAADLAAIDRLDRHRRYVDGAFWELPGGPYTVANLWDE